MSQINPKGELKEYLDWLDKNPITEEDLSNIILIEFFEFETSLTKHYKERINKFCMSAAAKVHSIETSAYVESGGMDKGKEFTIICIKFTPSKLCLIENRDYLERLRKGVWAE